MAWTRSRAVFVLLLPGSSIGTGVSSVWSFVAARTVSLMRATIGSSRASPWPVPIDVDACAAMISVWRYKGRWWSNFETRTCAIMRKLALPRAMAFSRAGACTILSQARQENFGRYGAPP